MRFRLPCLKADGYPSSFSEVRGPSTVGIVRTISPERRADQRDEKAVPLAPDN